MILSSPSRQQLELTTSRQIITAGLSSAVGRTCSNLRTLGILSKPWPLPKRMIPAYQNFSRFTRMMTTAGKIGSWLNWFHFLPLFSKMLGKGDLFPPPAFVFLFLLSLRSSPEHVDIFRCHRGFDRPREIRFSHAGGMPNGKGEQVISLRHKSTKCGHFDFKIHS